MFRHNSKIFLSSSPTDMRKAINGRSEERRVGTCALPIYDFKEALLLKLINILS